MAIVGFDSSLLLNYYSARQPTGASPSSSSASKTANTLPPWDLRIRKLPQERQDVAARSSDPYFDPKDTSLLSKSGTSQNYGSQLEALLHSTLSNASTAANSAVASDNNKLFALYKALDRLDYIAKMATRDGTVDGQRLGLDKNFQDGLSQIQSFVDAASFANLTVMSGQKAASTQSTATIAYAKSEYVGGAAAKDADVFKPLAGVSASDTFTVSVTKAGVKTDVAIDLANVSGPLTIDNIAAYVNSQLSAQGFGTRFGRVQTGGSIIDGTATWGFKISNQPSETVSLSSPQAKAAVYVAGASGKPDDSQGKLVKLSGLDGTPASVFNANIAPDSGTASAKAAATDSQGNVYVVGNSSGSFGSELNQGAQDVFLTKYDSSGSVVWTKLLGSAGTANGYSLAVDPSSGGVVIAGSVTGDLNPNAIGGGTDSFVAKYDSEGNQTWVRQVAPAANDQANAVSVDASGNIYVGGQVSGTLGGQTSSGGADAYLTKLDSKGTLVFQRQFGTAGSDSAVRTAVAEDGNTLVASVENGHAFLTKYSAADGTSPTMWRVDLGDLQGGTIGGLTVANGKVYLSGSTTNASLDASGAASVAHASSGGSDAFVFAAADNGASATPDFVTYVGTGASEQGGGVTVANGKIYLAGTTTGTFAGETRSVEGTHNMFVAELDGAGNVDWAQQFGGLDGQSQGFAIAADNSGSSVLDALKIPRGKIDVNQSNRIESQTTARAGDYFSLQITGKNGGTRTLKITIAKGETLRSLATKINGALLFDGKATALGVKGGQGLKIAVNEGVQVNLIAGPKDFDALAGLGIQPQLLVNDGKTDSTKDDAAKTPAADQTIGLAINGGINLATKSAASHAHVVLLGAMAQIKQAYTKLNAPPASGTPAATGAAPAYLQSQLAGYQTALAWLNANNGG